ncbi:MAG: VTT domain-containing protein [Gemmataceae bacterium]|nr:VTT domain-containing protein [Gemmataceae bacterium]
MDELFTQVGGLLREVVTNLTNPDAWKLALQRPEVTLAAFIAVNLIVFTETGLLFGFFLPGDSLLVTAGVAGYIAGWPIHWLILTLWGAAILGDSSGYLIGRTAGPRLFRKEKSLLFRKDYLLAAQDFYNRHGGKTIVLAKFVPFLRTFAPVVAGAGRMPYRRFLAFSVGGAVAWTTSMVMLGYGLIPVLDPALTWLFGRPVAVAKNIDLVIVLVIAASVAPLMYKAGRRYLARRRAARVGAGGPPAPTA